MSRLEHLLDLLTKLAQQRSDGHYTILRFTTGYKVALGTPHLTSTAWDAYFQVQALPQFATLEEAIEHVLFNAEQAHFDGDWLTEQAAERRAKFEKRE